MVKTSQQLAAFPLSLPRSPLRGSHIYPIAAFFICSRLLTQFGMRLSHSSLEGCAVALAKAKKLLIFDRLFNEMR